MFFWKEHKANAHKNIFPIDLKGKYIYFLCTFLISHLRNLDINMDVHTIESLILRAFYMDISMDTFAFFQKNHGYFQN